MQGTGTGRPTPTVDHSQSPTINPPSNYTSGFCSTAHHEHCRGDFRTARCNCACHTAPPPEPIPTVTVRCVFGCRTVVDSVDPWAAHEGMEAHYADAHAQEIAAATGGAA